MTLCVLTAGLVIINDLTHTQHRQILDVQLGKVGDAISDTLSRSGVDSIPAQAERLQSELRTGLEVNSAYIYILEESGRVIFHPKRETGEMIDWNNLPSLFTHKQGAVEFTEDGVSLFAVYSRIQANNWLTIIAIDEDEMYAREADYFRTIALITLGIFILSALIVSLYVRRFVSRLQVTLDGIKRIEKGDLETTIPIEADDEVGRLQAGVNTMSARIRQRTIEQQDAEQAKRDSENRYQQLFDTANEGIWVQDENFRTTMINEHMAQMLGYTAAEIQGRKVTDFMFDEEVSAHAEKIEERSHNISDVYERRMRHKDGTPVWMLISATPIFEEGRFRGSFAMLSDITDRKTAEQKLAASEHLFRTLVENSPDHIARYDLALRRVYINPILEKTFSVPVEKALGQTAKTASPLLDPDRYMDNLKKVIETGQEVSDEIAYRTPQNELRWASARFAPEFGIDGKVQSVLAISNDITEQKLAEYERQDLLDFLESLDRINRVLQSEGDIEQIMHEALDEALEIFGSDRAFLIYPCDPDAETWSVPIESTRPDYPGASLQGPQPMEAEMSTVMRALLEADHPLQIGPEGDFPITPLAREKYHTQAVLVSILRPRVDKPWQFGIQQCSHERIWSDQEIRLFEEIGHRLSDGLNNLLISRNLRESEERFRLVFENSPVSIQEEDYSAVKSHLESLSHEYGDDLGAYLTQRPELLKECAARVRKININQAALTLLEAENKEAVLRGLPQIFVPETMDNFRKIVTALMQGQTTIRTESVIQNLHGHKFPIDVFVSVCPGYEESLGKILVSLIDISERKQAELERQDHLHFLESLDRINLVLQTDGDLEEVLSRTLDEILDIFRCDRVYLQYPCDPEASSEWWMPMERCHPDYPSPLPSGRRLPYNAHIADTMRALLETKGPVRVGPGTERPIPADITDKLGVRSLLSIAIYPRVDRPWQFGIHQCSHARIWTDEEVRLFEEISHRLSDGINDLLVSRNLRDSEERFRQVFENSPVSIWDEDFSAVKARLDELQADHGDDLETYLETHPEVVNECAGLVRIINVNQAALDLHEADSKKTLYEGLHKTFIPESYEAFTKELIALVRGETELQFDGTVQTLNGERREVTVSFSVCPGYEESLSKVFVSLFDITQRKQDEDQLRLAASVFSTSQEGILISDANNRIIDVNPAFSRLTGYSREEALGRDPGFLNAGRRDPGFFKQMWEEVNANGEWQGEIWNRRKAGDIYPELLSIVAVKDDQGVLQHYVGAFSDISALKKHEADLDRIAHYDTLTSVANRRLLRDRLDQAIAHARRNYKSLAVCYLDLDGFKPINDRFGHESGDRMLIEVARRLEAMSRGDDTIARLGGDEFVLLWNDINGESDCARVLERVLNKIAEPMLLKDNTVSVSASIGVTLYPDDNVDADSLLRHADHAMYTAKQLGKNRYQFFDTRLERQISQQVELSDKISSGLDRAQFELYYQPKIDYTTQQVVGVEALLRWNDPVLGLVGPKEFISLIENNALSLCMGRWIMEHAVRQARSWHEKGLVLPVSINVFSYHLKYQSFVTDLRNAIAANWPQMPGQLLSLEIVESEDLEELEPIEQIIQECLSMGINFSLDDFGTGYSSLVYLRRLTIHELKIDQSFVRDMLQDPSDEAIVYSVISLGKAFGLRVVAEGVESIEQAEHLVEMGCPIVQGFCLGHPMPAHAFERWLADFYPSEVKICEKQ